MLNRCASLVLVSLAACATVGSREFNEAILPSGAVEEAFRSEYGWRHAWDRERDDQGDWWFENNVAGSRILVLAAHTETDSGTAGLACALASYARVNAVYGVGKAPFEPLRAHGEAFEEALMRVIDATQPKLIVDLREGGIRAADVDFDTGNGEWTHGTTAVSVLADALRAEGVAVLTRDARLPRRRGRYPAKLSRKAPYLRLWINPSRLPARADAADPRSIHWRGSHAAQAQRVAQLLQGLVRGLRSLDSIE